MFSNPVFLTTAIFIIWGTSSFLAKVVANKLGVASIFWDVLGSFPVIMFYSFFVLKPKNLMPENKLVILLGLSIGLIGAFGGIFFYHLLSQTEASIAIPLTALYPALTVILSIIFLKEALTLAKLLGIVFSLVAIYFLSQ
ncbi:EamA family transporter [Patescibacteria group bacterium]